MICIIQYKDEEEKVDDTDDSEAKGQSTEKEISITKSITNY